MENQKILEYEKTVLKAEMDRKLSEQEKDAALNLERAMSSKEKEKSEVILELQKQNAVLQAKIEMLTEKSSMQID